MGFVVPTVTDEQLAEVHGALEVLIRGVPRYHLGAAVERARGLSSPERRRAKGRWAAKNESARISRAAEDVRMKNRKRLRELKP